jgi:hypothetical protein
MMVQVTALVMDMTVFVNVMVIIMMIMVDVVNSEDSLDILQDTKTEFKKCNLYTYVYFGRSFNQ